MNRSLLKYLRWCPLILAMIPTQVPAQQSASVTEAETKSPANPTRPAVTVPSRVFAFAVSSESAEARHLVEVALNEYENVALDAAANSSRRATEQDPHFALAYAMWSFAARRNNPNPEALRKAESLAENAPTDERLLVNFMAAVQKTDMLPAITAMNDLLAHSPNDRHAIYLSAEWLYAQQDFDRSVRMMEQVIKLDPNFAPAYNMLGYAKVETGIPDPAKGIAYLKRYAELQPGHPNPEDSLGEVSRFVGDDAAAIQHYHAALKLQPTFITSQTGLGDTYTLMRDFAQAKTEYAKAAAMCANPADCLHVEFQTALVNFWEGRPARGLLALEQLGEKARAAHQPYSEFEIQEARALLSPRTDEQLQKLSQLEVRFSKPLDGMTDSDRNPTLAAIWRDQVRILAGQHQLDHANSVVHKLEGLAASSRDLLVEDCYESARGYVFYAEKDFNNAADELSADPHSPIALYWLAAAQEKSGNSKGAESVKLRLKYLRAPTTEWLLTTQFGKASAN